MLDLGAVCSLSEGNTVQCGNKSEFKCLSLIFFLFTVLAFELCFGAIYKICAGKK
jgi:hypothetical protein